MIHILDSETIDKIAAGEVVERPSSVVKELVENAIDALATAITVEVKEGGIELIRVTDNGTGIEKEQLRTAFMRHATSKLDSAEDLVRISSLGFRGEALSSISAVAKVEVITRRREKLTGIRMLLEGAAEKGFEEIGAPEGTTFIVRNLFFNTPVRRKFLKQPATEGGYIADLMEHLALSRPDISFKFVLGNQIRFHTSGNGDLREVIYRIYGRELAASLIPIQVKKDGVSIEGYLGKPVLVRSNRSFEIYYMNGRFIKSTVISKAIEEGYREYLMQHKFPFCVLHISMDTDKVDVNVHPTKMDVRFSDAAGFCVLLSEAVQNTLKNREMLQEATLSDKQDRETARQEKSRQTVPEPFEKKREEAYRVMEEAAYRAQPREANEFKRNPVWSRVLGEQAIVENNTGEKEAEEKKQKALSGEEVFFVEAKEPDWAKEEKPQAVESKQREEKLQKEEALEEEKQQAEEMLPGDTQQLSFFEERLLTMENRSRYQIIGQVFDTYWLVQFEDKLFMIDQHAAHEKVKYERLMKQYREKQVVSQRLMPPVIVSLTGQEESVFREYDSVFAELGFEVESFGGNEYALRSVPADLYGCSEREMFLATLDELAEGIGRGSLRVIEEKIASMSCKAAVKGNNRLSRQEAEKLIDELLTLDNPYNCPHGRPTIIVMSKTEMEKKFKRIV